MITGEVVREIITVDGLPWLSGPTLPDSWVKQAERRALRTGERIEMWITRENGSERVL